MAKTTHWRPDPLEDAFSQLNRFTVDTDRYANPDTAEVERQMEIDAHRMTCTADPFYAPESRDMKYGLRSVHVTDDPSVVIGALEQGADLQQTRPWGDLCGGLYVSSCPDIWISRSRKKWEFLESLSADKAKKLAGHILNELHDKRRDKYLSDSEYDFAVLQVGHLIDSGNWHPLITVANQPYNVNIQDLARRHKIAEPFQPVLMNVWFEGRYVELNEKAAWEAAEQLTRETFNISDQMMRREDICNALRHHQWDGCFTRSSWSTNAELVIWNADRIRIMGDWKRRSKATSLGHREGGTVFGGERFEASVSPSRKKADIRDLAHEKSYFTMLHREHLEELKGIVDAVLRGEEVSVMTGRFIARGDVSRDGLDIVFVESRQKFWGLDVPALQELQRILQELLGESQ